MAIGWMAAAMLAQVSSASAPSFCERMAVDLKMKPTKSENGSRVWEVNTMGRLGAALFGGTSVLTMGVEPIGEPTVADYKRLEKLCEATTKGAICAVAGPLAFHVGVKGIVFETKATVGERADVSIKVARIRRIDRPA